MHSFQKKIEFDAGCRLTSDKDVNVDGGGADDGGLDILVVAAVVSGVPGLSPQQRQPLAVGPGGLPRTLADHGNPLVRAAGGWQLALTAGNLLYLQRLIGQGPHQRALPSNRTGRRSLKHCFACFTGLNTKEYSAVTLYCKDGQIVVESEMKI